MAEVTAAVSPLRRRMIDDMSLRNLSPATQRSYLHAVTKFSRYFGRSPDRLGLEDVRAFQVYLVSQGISWPALNQTVCALRSAALHHPKPFTGNRPRDTNPIARGRVSGFVQSGFNEVANPAKPDHHRRATSQNPPDSQISV